MNALAVKVFGSVLEKSFTAAEGQSSELLRSLCLYCVYKMLDASTANQTRPRKAFSASAWNNPDSAWIDRAPLATRQQSLLAG